MESEIAFIDGLRERRYVGTNHHLTDHFPIRELSESLGLGAHALAIVLHRANSHAPNALRLLRVPVESRSAPDPQRRESAIAPSTVRDAIPRFSD